MMDEPDGVVNRYSKTNRPKPKKKDIEKRNLMPLEIKIDRNGSKRL